MDEALVEKVARAIYEVFPDRSWDSVLRGVSAGLEGLIWEYEDTMLRARAAIQAAQEEMWRPISEAKTDGTEYWVYVSLKYDLPGFITRCAYHPDAGWCADELRDVTHFTVLPLPPSKGGQNG